MDITRYAESEFLNADCIKNSLTKKGIILNSGTEEVLEGKQRLSFLVEIDGKVKKWNPNQKSTQELLKAYGKDSEAWRGKTVNFTTGLMKNGKDGVLVVI